MSSRRWIKRSIDHPGALHRALHVPAGAPIPLGKLRAAAHAPGRLGRRARLALTLRGLGRHHRHR